MNRLAILIISALLVCTAAGFGLWRAFQEPPEVAFRTGLAAARKNDWATVSRSLQRLAHEPAFKPQRQLLIGLFHLGHGETKRGLANLAAAGEHRETQVDAWAAAGCAYYELKQFARSIRILKQVNEWAPNHEEANRYLASACYDVGDMDGALAALDRVIAVAPQDYRNYRLQALILKDYERFDEAARQFRNAVERLNPDDRLIPGLRCDWARCLVKLRRYQEALDVLQAVNQDLAAESDRRTEMLVIRAEAQFNLRRFDDARSAATAALELSPGHAEASVIAARIAEEDGDLPRAVRILRQAVTSAPFDSQLHGRLADVLAQSGLAEESQTHRAEAARLVALQVRFSETHEQAIQQPDNAAIRVDLALQAEQLHRPELSRMWLDAALGLAPDDPRIQQACAEFQSRHPEPAQPPGSEPAGK